jgi:hypothetical protein
MIIELLPDLRNLHLEGCREFEHCLG